ncbi:MAG: lipoyl(octanoyl) transferase LipB [Rhodobacteraceae bacterium]|nr:lipoyl(octanoyl) transferase LipB [Paracoccaceae bacterium]MCY4196112.1 lipoyl(octanoyl) transferase LipB [Paracoccaceae bacterium]
MVDCTIVAESALVEWIISRGLTDYADAISRMEGRAESIACHQADEMIWLLEHPSLFTTGTATCEDDFAEDPPFPVFQTGRGGRVTYHGPGQRIIYTMLDLRQRGRDVRHFVRQCEQWVIESLSQLGVVSGRNPPHTGVWTWHQGHQVKLAAMGFRIRRWVTFHGISINVNPDLNHYRSIVPCGIRSHGVTSLTDVGYKIDMADLDTALQMAFDSCFETTPSRRLFDPDSLFEG